MQLQEISKGRDCYALSGATRLSVDSKKSDSKRAVARGIAITTGMLTKYFRFSKASVMSLRPQAIRTESSNGVPMYILHMDFWELPVGRTLMASFKKESDLEVEFYLSRDVPQPHTNSIIDRIDDKTIDSLSLGWGLIAQGKRPSYFKCDVCGEKMDRGYFMPYCSNYHYPGKRLKENKKEIIVTATVHGDIRFRELSIVGGGADPRAKILNDPNITETLKTELETLHIQAADFATIAELAGWNETLFSDTLSLGIYNPAVPSPESIEKHFLGGLNQMSEPTATATPQDDEELASIADSELRTLYDEAKTKVEELEAQLEDVIALDEHNTLVSDLRTQINEKKVEVETAEAKASENEELAEIGREALSVARTRTEHAYRTLKSNKVEDQKSQKDLKKIQESMSIQWLSTEMDKLWDMIGEHQNTNAHRDQHALRTRKDYLKGVEVNTAL